MSFLFVGCSKVTVHVHLSPTATPNGASVATPAPTSVVTATPVPSLKWQQAQNAPYDDWSFAPSNGNIGYDCNFDMNSHTTTMFMTHDRGMHLSQSAIPSVQGEGRCEMLVDANDAAIAVAKERGSFPITSMAFTAVIPRSAMLPRSSPGDQEISDFITTDGGQRWRIIPNYITIDYVVNIGSRIYAFIGTNPRFAGEPFLRDPHFVVSSDGMQSWQELPLPPSKYFAHSTNHLTHSEPFGVAIPAINQFGSFPQLLADPYTGYLFYPGYAGSDDHVVILRSTNGGYSWQPLAAPQPVQQFMFSLSGENHPVKLCFTNGTSLWCSADAGQTWQQRKINNPVDFNEFDSDFANLSGIASNGDLLMDYNGTLNRLAPHATTWQAFGTDEGYGATLYGPAGTNLLWSVLHSAQEPQGDQWFSVAYP